MFMFCSRDYNAEGVKPRGRSIIDYAKDCENEFDEEAWEQRKNEDTNK